MSGIGSDFYMVGSYNKNPSAADLKSSYRYLNPGDALVTSGHTFLVMEAYSDSVIVFEQTPPQAIVTTWTFDDLADGKYRPFTKNVQNGWYEFQDEWYYFVNGDMASGWKEIAGIWYYFDEYQNFMYTGWQDIDGERYYFRSDGAMHIGWWQEGSNWYYFNGDGAMVSYDWLEEDGNWYWLKADGRMAKNESIKINDTTYHFDSDGVCTNPY